MELDIIELDSFVFGCSALCFVISLIIESQFEIRHARELAISINYPDDLAFDDVVGRSN